MHCCAGVDNSNSLNIDLMENTVVGPSVQSKRLVVAEEFEKVVMYGITASSPMVQVFGTWHLTDDTGRLVFSDASQAPAFVQRYAAPDKQGQACLGIWATKRQ